MNLMFIDCPNLKFVQINKLNIKKFKNLIDCYQKIIDKDKKLKFYLDAISKNYFNKNLIFNNPFSGFNFMNLFRMFSNDGS